MNALKNTIALVIFILLGFSSQAQLRETFHEVYDLNDIESIEVNLDGDISFLKWKGTTLMAETIVELGNATKGVLRYLIKKQRYEITSDSDGSTLKLESFDKERKAVVTRDGACDEYIGVIIYVPEDYEVVSDNLIVKSTAESDSATTGDE